MFFKQRKQDMEEEILPHLRMAIQERVNRGEPIEQARKAALRECGNAFLRGRLRESQSYLLRTPTTTRPTPATNETMLRIGEIGIVFVSL